MARRSTLVMMLALVLPSSTDAQSPSPIATSVAIDPGDCTVEPRSIDEMRELIRIGVPPIVSFLAGTPVMQSAATPSSSLDNGQPADAATVANVTETIQQFVACSNEPNMPAVASLLTEQGAASYLSFAFLSFQATITGTTNTPPADPDPDLLNMFLASLQLQQPLPPNLRMTLYDIEHVTQMNDGRVRVIARLATGSEEERKTSIMLREEDERYRIIFGPEPGSDTESAGGQ